MSSKSSRRLAIGALAMVASLAVTIWFVQPNYPDLSWARVRDRPRWIFVNQTSLQGHDLALKMSLQLAEKKSGAETALVMLRKLPRGQSIESVAQRLFRERKIGDRRSGKGLLILRAEEENLIRIEVSRALEGALPDVLCRRLEEAARSYMLSEVPQDYLSELIILLNLRVGDDTEGVRPHARKGEPALLAFGAPSWWMPPKGSAGGGVTGRGWTRSYDVYRDTIRAIPVRADVSRFEPGGSPTGSLERYLESLRQGIGDPRLPLLTEGSQILRMVVPRGEAHVARIAEFWDKAGQFTILERASVALAVPKPGGSNLPVVLRRGLDGLWRVDEAKSWQWFHRFEDGIDFWTKYPDNPFLPQLAASGYPGMERTVFGQWVPTPAPIEGLGLTISNLEKRLQLNPTDWRAYYDLGEVFLFEMSWLTRAREAFAAAAALAPEAKVDPKSRDQVQPEHWPRFRLLDVDINLSRMEDALLNLKWLADRFPQERALKAWHAQYARAYDFSPEDFGP